MFKTLTPVVQRVNMATATQEAEAIAREIGEVYIRIIPQRDKFLKDRIDFLKAVVRGRLESTTLERAVEELEKKNHESPEAKECRAMYEMWKWYLEPTERRQARVEIALKRAGLTTILDVLPKCLSILRVERPNYFKRVFDDALRYADAMKDDPGLTEIEKAKLGPLEKRRADVILAAAETVTRLEPDLLPYVMSRLPSYALKSEYTVSLPLKKAA
jgi:hypothetical protein